MNFLSKITAFIFLALILGFEAYHVDTHLHELEHSQDTVAVTQFEGNDLPCALHNDNNHKHSEHGHPNYLSSSVINDNFSLQGPLLQNKYITHLWNGNNCGILISRASFAIKAYEKGHPFLYKNPFQFRNRYLII